MAVAMGGAFLVQPCSSSLCFMSKNIHKSSLGVEGAFWPIKPGSTRYLAVRAQQRPTWLPGLDPPPYLDGT